VKVGIKPYVGEVDAIKLNQWIQYMEVYLSVHEITEKQRIAFAWLNLEWNALAWWESDVIGSVVVNEPQ
jgi:hypothetical protein